MTVTPDGTSRPSSRRAASLPNPSSCSHALPTPATRICVSNSGLKLHLVGTEEQVAADVADDVLARDVVDGHVELHTAVVVDVGGLERRAPAAHQMVLRVATRAGAQQHRVAGMVGDAVDGRRGLALL